MFLERCSDDPYRLGGIDDGDPAKRLEREQIMSSDYSESMTDE